MSDETVRAPRHVLLEETLASIVEALRARPSSVFTRDQLVEAERYLRVVSEWHHRPPAHHQVAAMFDCVVALRAKVAQGSSLSMVPEPLPESGIAGRSTDKLRKVSR